MMDYTTASTGAGTEFTKETLLDALKTINAIKPVPRPKIVVTLSAVQQDGWNFKPSIHRSKRIHKKLMKRYGTQERMVPCMVQMGEELMLVHPAFMATFKELAKEKIETVKAGLLGNAFFGTPVFNSMF